MQNYYDSMGLLFEGKSLTREKSYGLNAKN